MEIKFRYWDQFNGCFTYSDSFTNPLYYNYRDLVDFFKQLYLAESGENNPILERYTGLKDKNGVEIYEGDIVKYCNSISSDDFYLQEICWNYDGYFAACWHEKPYGMCTSDAWASHCEVIGNIHENQKLMEKEK